MSDEAFRRLVGIICVGWAAAFGWAVSSVAWWAGLVLGVPVVAVLCFVAAAAVMVAESD